jgi:hypothetical protein
MSKDKKLERDEMLENAIEKIKDWSNIHGINKNSLEQICIQRNRIGTGIFLSGCIPKYIHMMNIGKPMLTEIRDALKEKKYNKLSSKDIHVRFDRDGGLFITIIRENSFHGLRDTFLIPDINNIIPHNNSNEKIVDQVVQEVVDKYKLKQLNKKYSGRTKARIPSISRGRTLKKSRSIPVGNK